MKDAEEVVTNEEELFRSKYETKTNHDVQMSEK